MKKYPGVLLFFLIFTVFAFRQTHVVSASTTTETVSYHVNKAGTDQPSVANGFFSGVATLSRPDDGPATVTLHLVKYASTIKSFAIGDQVAKITNATDDTADLTFELDDSFQLPVVQAAMSVMNMNQKADLVFAQALYQPELSTATVPDLPKTEEANPSVADPDATVDTATTAESAPIQTISDAKPLDQSATTTSADVDATTSSAKSDSVQAAGANDSVLADAGSTTETVSYQVNKAGTDTPSLSNGFFTGQAVVTIKDARADTVTLHLQQYASMIKSFSIGDQPAKLSNVTDDTADLTFTVDEQFSKPIVQANMTVMNMNQEADLVFAKALYQPTETKPQSEISTPIQSPSETNPPIITGTSTTDPITETPSTIPENAAQAQPSSATDEPQTSGVDQTTEPNAPATESEASMQAQSTETGQPTTVETPVTDQPTDPDASTSKPEDSIQAQSASETDVPVTTQNSGTDQIADTTTPSTKVESSPQTSTASKASPTPSKSASVEAADQGQVNDENQTSDQTPSTPANNEMSTPTAAKSQTVAYHVNKAGTDTPSISNSFFTGQATITTKDGQPETVTLHIQQHASAIERFSIGTQSAKMTNVTADTADLTFNIDQSFAKPVVTASMSVMGTDQQADLVFAQALYHSDAIVTKPAETQTPSVGEQSTKPATIETQTADNIVDHQANTGEVKTQNQSQVTTPKTDATTPSANPVVSNQSPTAPSLETVKYHVNKVGTDTPSISNSFFTGQATITTRAGQPETVTLHIQQHASAIKSFSIGTQQAKMTNVTADTADLTFNIDQSFAKPVVTASMSVMGMDQQADLVFTQALYHSDTTVTKPTESQMPSVGEQSTKPAPTDTQTQPADNIVDHQATTSEVKTLNQSQVTTPKTDATTTSTKPVVSNQSPVAPATETVKYHVNKAGTNTPSIANDFFTGEATVTLKAGQAQTVTLHLQQYASAINTFSIGDQNVKITNVNGDTGDLTFTIDANFAKPVVEASISVMNMNQKADIVFAKALAQPTTQTAAAKTPVANQQPGKTAVQQTDKPFETPKQADSPAKTTITSRPSQNVTTQSEGQTQTVAYHVNKTGTNTPSLADEFFSGQATITSKAGQPQIVTLHLQKYASTIKSFAIGAQNAKITNVTGDTADLTFTIDASFAKPIVQASMSVMNMNQTADLVFAKALYQENSTDAPVATSSTRPKSVEVAATKPSVVVKPQTQIAAPTQQAGEVSAKLYQAQNGQLTHNPSAAQQFISQSAKVVRHATSTTVTLHTTGAEYIQAMRVAGQLGKITNRHGANADLVFTLSNQALSYALPVSFSLVVPGAGAMTQSAFLLLDLPVQAAKVHPVAKAFTTTTISAAAVRPVVASTTAHAINAQLAQQTIPYTVLDAGGSALSTANQYFTHSARVVKAGSGYDVYLTVQVAAGIVNFTPISVNGGAVSDLTHVVIGGQDVWTFRFHVADANSLDQLIPATILMSVPMANISNQRFNIEFAFARLAQANVARVNTPATSQASKTKALKPITITKKTVKATSKTTSTTQATSKGLDAQPRLATLKHYPIGWEALAFTLGDALILLGAWLIRRRRVGEVTHD